MWQGFIPFSVFLHHFVMAKLATSSIRVNISHALGIFSILTLTKSDHSLTNPCAASGYFGQYKKKKIPEKLLKPWQMGTHLRGNYPMSTKMTGFRWFSKLFAFFIQKRKLPQHWKG